MLRELEQRLADVLGAGLPAPIAGAVDVAPGNPNSQVIVSVKRAEPMSEDFRSQRPEQVTGAAGRRAVVRLKCDVALEVRALPGQQRTNQMDAFDRLLFFVDDAVFRSGRRLDGGAADPGFFLQAFTVRACEPPGLISMDASGLFWPVGTPGASGDPIQQIITRMVSEPILLEPARPPLVAGGPAVNLIVRLGAVNAMEIVETGAGPRTFGDLVLRITDAGGRPGQGTLAGGVAAPNGAQRIAVAEGAVAFEYTPPAQPATDILHVSFDNQEIGQIELRVRGA